MKTLTELSGTLVRTAAAAIDAARRSLPKDGVAQAAEPAPPAADASAPPPAAAEGAGAAEAAEAAPPDAAPEGARAEPPPPAAPSGPAKGGESEAVKAALDAAVGAATGLSGDRLTMLRAAVEAAGRRAEDVRLVRVFGPDEQVPGASAIGGYQYVVDFFPASMKQVAGGSREDRGRGRGGRGGGRGGGGGGGAGGRGSKAGATGGFSMDAVREDRRNERGGRGRPGGPRRPGSRPGGSGGDPKK
jgi:translation initiation factor IF-2